MFYSPSTKGFYSIEIHNVMPEDVVEISQEHYEELLASQQTGKEIVPSEDGSPIAIVASISPADYQLSLQSQAKQYLASTDWYVIRKIETNVEIPQDILDQRAAARLTLQAV